MAELVLGRDPQAAADSAPVSIETGDLVTHGIIVGMTGSGKTGLGIGLIEETLAAGVPTLLIDPKGDLTNLALVFPELSGAEFQPWVDPAQASAAGVSVAEYAEGQAQTWRDGLAPWGIGPEQMRAFKESFGLTIYTPGSTAGVPLNVLGSLVAPQTDDPEVIADEIEGYVTSLLSVVGIEADPLASREHILLSNIISAAWSAGESLDLAALLARVQQPPLRKLGVFELDAFFPPKDRNEFAMRLNGVLAAPSFANWIAGDPIDIQRMLFAEDGSPKCAVVTTAHLSDEQRQSATALVLAKLVTWMRRQSGTTDLRVMLYMDEVAGYLPPTGNPPTKKPIMLLMKQARAFGVGVVLSTQNPVDIDYKALSNAGTWLIGRLTTERDKARLLEGMSSAAGGVDTAAVSDAISGLGKRQFLVRKAGRNDVVTFATRWVRSYLRGPMTRDQIAEVMAGRASANPAPAQSPAAPAEPTAAPAAPAAQAPAEPTAAPAAPAEPTAAPAAPAEPTAAPAAPAEQTPAASPSTPQIPAGAATAASATTAAETPQASAPAVPTADDETPVMPNVAEGVPVGFLDPGAPWTDQLGLQMPTGHGPRLEAAAAARVIVRYSDARTEVNYEEEFEAIVFPLPAATAVVEPTAVDYDDRDFAAPAPPGARFAVPEAKIATKTYWTSLQRDLVDYLVRSKPLELLANTELKLYSRPGETPEEFAARCVAAAEAEADKKTAALRSKYEAKLAGLQSRLVAAANNAQQAEAARNADVIGGVGSVLGGLFGGRRSTSAISAAARKATTAQNRVASAAAKVDDLQAQIAEVEYALTAEIDAIAAEAAAQAAAVTTKELAPKKADVRVIDLRLVWLPTG